MRNLAISRPVCSEIANWRENAGATTENPDLSVGGFAAILNPTPLQRSRFPRPHFLRRNGCSPTGRDFVNLAISRRAKFGRGNPRANLQPTTERAEKAEGAPERRPRAPRPPTGRQVCDPPKSDASPQRSQFFAAAFLAPKRLLSAGSRIEKSGDFPAGQIWPRDSAGKPAANDGESRKSGGGERKRQLRTPTDRPTDFGPF